MKQLTVSRFFLAAGMLLWVLLAMVSAFAQTERETTRAAIGFWDIWALPRVWVGALLALAGVITLMSGRLNKWLRLIFLLIIFLVFSVVSFLPLGDFASGMGLHPSPMCSVEKPFMFVQMGRSVPIVFVAILAFVALLTVVANKSFCGWNCPIGAVQELLHSIPLPKKLKIKLPFKVTNTIRMAFFLLFVAVLFRTGLSLYAYVNPFEFLHWSLEWAVIPAFAITFIAAFFIFRPFCYLICPLGLLTWLLEHVSILRVRVDKSKCTLCLRCVKESPCPAVPAILDEKRTRPDCHACGACIASCPEQALKLK
jgi:ferredoxin-type protein NapH